MLFLLRIAGNSNIPGSSKARDNPTSNATDAVEAVILENITDSVLLQSTPGSHGLSHGAHGISHGVHGLSHGVHGLSHGVHGSSHGAHSLSHGAHGLSHGLHGLSHGVAHSLAHSNAHGLMHSAGHSQGLPAGDGDISSILSISEAELELEASELEKESLDVNSMVRAIETICGRDSMLMTTTLVMLNFT